MEVNYWNTPENNHTVCYQDMYPKLNLIEYIYLDEELHKDDNMPKECVGIWRIKNNNL